MFESAKFQLKFKKTKTLGKSMQCVKRCKNIHKMKEEIPQIKIEESISKEAKLDRQKLTEETQKIDY